MAGHLGSKIANLQKRAVYGLTGWKSCKFVHPVINPLSPSNLDLLSNAINQKLHKSRFSKSNHRSHPKSLTDRPSKMENYGKLLDFPFWWVWVTFQGQTLQPSKGENLKVFLFKVDASPGAFLHGQRVPVPVPLATTLGAAPQPARYPGCGEIYSKKWLDQLCL